MTSNFFKACIQIKRHIHYEDHTRVHVSWVRIRGRNQLSHVCSKNAHQYLRLCQVNKKQTKHIYDCRIWHVQELQLTLPSNFFPIPRKIIGVFNIGTLEWVAPYVALIRTRDTTQHRHYTDTLAQNLNNWRIRRVGGNIMENIYVYYHMNNLFNKALIVNMLRHIYLKSYLSLTKVFEQQAFHHLSVMRHIKKILSYLLNRVYYFV